MQRLTKRNKRALILLAVVVAVMVLVSYVILPFYDAKGQIRSDIQSKQKELALSARTLEEKDAYLRSLAAVERVIAEYESAVWDARDASSATVQVEETVRAFANQHGVRVTRSNPLPEQKIGDEYIKISLQLNVESDMGGLVGFLHSIASHEKFLVVDEFNLASFRVRDKTQIRPRMRISGYVRLS